MSNIHDEILDQCLRAMLDARCPGGVDVIKSTPSQSNKDSIHPVGHKPAARQAGPLPAVDFIPDCCPGLEVPAGSCSSLPVRSLLSHPGDQRSQFPPLNRTGGGGTSCPFSPYFHKANPCILSGWPLRVEWASVGTQGSF